MALSQGGWVSHSTHPTQRVGRDPKGSPFDRGRVERGVRSCLSEEEEGWATVGKERFEPGSRRQKPRGGGLDGTWSKAGRAIKENRRDGARSRTETQRKGSRDPLRLAREPPRDRGAPGTVQAGGGSGQGTVGHVIPEGKAGPMDPPSIGTKERTSSRCTFRHVPCPKEKRTGNIPCTSTKRRFE
eukprot:scaffold320_cov335-Pavlova_lutheri.AAC.8